MLNAYSRLVARAATGTYSFFAAAEKRVSRKKAAQGDEGVNPHVAPLRIQCQQLKSEGEKRQNIAKIIVKKAN
jgi:hypothetical protein